MQLYTRVEIQQFLLHYDASDSEIYNLDKVKEIRLKKKNNGKYRSFYFLLFCFKLRIKNLFLTDKQYFDISHWHVFRVYPFFWLLPAKKHIISIHDAGHYILPYTQTLSNKLFIKIIKKNLNKIFKILVLSHNAKNNLVKIGKFPENKIEIIYPGSHFNSLISDNPFNPSNTTSPGSYIVCVSRWQPHKNVGQLVEAFNLYLRNQPNSTIKLVLVGKPVAHHDLPLKAIKKYGLEKRVLVLSDLKDSELAWLYDNAIFSIFPSIHEGFGLAVLESLCRGCPAMVDINTSTAEVVGDAGLCVNMQDTKQLAASIEKLTLDLDLLQSFRNNCIKRSEFFSWENSISKLIKIYTKF